MQDFLAQPGEDAAAQRPAASEPHDLFQAGRTCWRIEKAGRAAVLIDAAEYFAALNTALESARHSVFIIGWDFNHRIRLRPGVPRTPILSSYLNRLVRRTKGLRVRVLKWDTPFLFEIRRRIIPFFWLNWITSRRLQFRLDSNHPLTGCQHQKLVVIDDAVAFCGGIDLTDGRWDGTDHPPTDSRRVIPGNGPYSPVHDLMMMVDGDAARALGDLARMRWQRATGTSVRPPPPVAATPWPATVPADFTGVDIAIARTEPAQNGEDGVREVEALNLAALASARRFVYIENQHFASRVIYEAILALLQKPDGPEIAVVNPDKCPGWVEEYVMGEARTQIINRLHHADRWNRFRIYTPHCAGGAPIYVHSKCLVIDDHFLRVGSSNFNNRSMGFDTECDVAVAARPGDETIRAGIAAIRDKLLAEHLGVAPEQLRAAVASGGLWLRAIEQLRRADTRSLRPIPFAEEMPDAAAPVTDSILDPEHVDRLPV